MTKGADPTCPNFSPDSCLLFPTRCPHLNQQDQNLPNSNYDSRRNDLEGG
jgi:hypothetical protein